MGGMEVYVWVCGGVCAHARVCVGGMMCVKHFENVCVRAGGRACVRALASD